MTHQIPRKTSLNACRDCTGKPYRGKLGYFDERQIYSAAQARSHVFCLRQAVLVQKCRVKLSFRYLLRYLLLNPNFLLIFALPFLVFHVVACALDEGHDRMSEPRLDPPQRNIGDASLGDLSMRTGRIGSGCAMSTVGDSLVYTKLTNPREASRPMLVMFMLCLPGEGLDAVRCLEYPPIPTSPPALL